VVRGGEGRGEERREERERGGKWPSAGVEREEELSW
jgi:hypothetical protein